jgi:hypothetical protein
MSPEQARRPKTVDTRTDIWALGVVLYEFLGGETPWVGDAPLEVLTAALSDPMPSLRELRRDVPPELEAVIAKCLEKNAADRYQTVAEFAEALRPFAPVESRRSISRIAGILRTSLAPAADQTSTTLKSASTPPPDTGDTEEIPGGALTPPDRRDRDKDTQMDWGKSQSGTRRSWRTLVLAATAFAVLVVVGFGLYGLGGRANVTPPAPKALAHAAEPDSPSAPAAPMVVPLPMPVTAAPPPSVAAPVASAAPAPVRRVAAPAAPVRAPAAVKPPSAAPAPASDDEDPLVNRR